MALTTLATHGLPPLKRGPEDWLEFSQAPAKHGGSLAPKPQRPAGGIFDFGSLMPWASPIKYVVRSDVVAFYRHVDHRLLADELIIQGADFEATEHLIDFLGEVEGRAVGLPQLYDASDVLSDIYIDSIERRMLRRGYAIWRFNDDFRISCKGYMETLKAIEDLDGCLRGMGLTLNEAKTTTPTFSNYYLEVMGLEVGEAGVVVARQDVEDVVGDYTDDFSQDADSAATFLNRLTDSPSAGGDEIDVRDAGPTEVRLARRALAALARQRDDRALDKVPILVRYLAELTPAAIKYVLALHKGGTARTKLAKVLDELASKTATNDWQKIWLIHGYAQARILELKRGRRSRLQWLSDCRMHWSAPPLRAYAVWALATAGELSVDDILSDQRGAPESLHLYYAAAVRSVGRPDDKAKRTKAFTHDVLLKGLASG